MNQQFQHSDTSDTRVEHPTRNVSSQFSPLIDQRSRAVGSRTSTHHTGRITAVRGTVLELQFDAEPPPISAAIHCSMDGESPVIAVTHAHLGGGRVQAVSIEERKGVRNRKR